MVLITGGAVVNVAPESIEWDYNKRVTVYGKRGDGTTGWISEMPEMNIARATHGCTSYFENGKRVEKFICFREALNRTFVVTKMSKQGEGSN